jgi:hypothetical protein
MPDITANASFGPIPLMPINRSKRTSSSGGVANHTAPAHPLEHGMNPERNIATLVAEAIVERRKWNRDVVTHAVHIDNYPIGLLGGEASPKVSDHGRAGR